MASLDTPVRYADERLQWAREDHARALDYLDRVERGVMAPAAGIALARGLLTSAAKSYERAIELGVGRVDA